MVETLSWTGEEPEESSRADKFRRPTRSVRIVLYVSGAIVCVFVSCGKVSECPFDVFCIQNMNTIDFDIICWNVRTLCDDVYSHDPIRVVFFVNPDSICSAGNTDDDRGKEPAHHQKPSCTVTRELLTAAAD